MQDDITRKGVVFNEMKGVYSSPDSVNQRTVQHSLFPDNTYGEDSGGDPKVIPELTFEEFKVHAKLVTLLVCTQSFAALLVAHCFNLLLRPQRLRLMRAEGLSVCACNAGGAPMSVGPVVAVALPSMFTRLVYT